MWPAAPGASTCPPGATPAFPDGPYLITANVTDAAGNPAVEATRTLTVDVVPEEEPPVNLAPVNTVPGTQLIEANHSGAIAGLAIADVDAGSGSLTTTLSVTHGMLTVAAVGGAGVTGSGSNTVTITGTLAEINATLGAANNVVYAAGYDVFNPDVLTVTTNDNGNTGTGGPLSDTDQVPITLTTWLIGTPGRTNTPPCPATSASTRATAPTPSTSTSAWSTRP